MGYTTAAAPGFDTETESAAIAMALKQTIFNGTLWAGSAQMLSMACNFLLTIVLARGLAPADYGLFFIALNTIVILVNFGALGMDRSTVRHASIRVVERDWRGLRNLLVTCFRIVFLCSLAAAAIFMVVGPAVFSHYIKAPGLLPYLGIMALWLIAATIQGELTESFRGLNDIRLASLFGGVRSNGIVMAVSVCSLMAVLTWTGQLTLARALWVMFAVAVAMVVVGAGILLLRVRRLTGSAPDGASIATAWSVRDALADGWPYWLTAIIVALRLQGGAWLAGAFDSNDNVALYGIAQRMTLLLAGPMIVGNAVLPPIIAQLHASGQVRRLERVVRSVSGLILLPSLLLTAVLVVAGRLILGGLFSPFYEAAYPMLLILCVGQAANIATGAWQLVLPMTGNQRLTLVASIISMLVQLGLGVWLGLRYGVLGVAVSFAASVVVSNLLGMGLVRWRLGIWTYASLDLGTIRDAAGLLIAKVRGRKVAWQKI